MSSQELDIYLQELSNENPLIQLEYPERNISIESLLALNPAPDSHSNMPLCEKDTDPFRFIAVNDDILDTLYDHLRNQINDLPIPSTVKSQVLYLAACLDADGYLRDPLEELVSGTTFTVPELQSSITILQSLEPAGVGARSLSECLVLQLKRINAENVTIKIANTCLEHLARGNINFISRMLKVTPEEVLLAKKTIQTLECRPGAIFSKSQSIGFVVPDVIVEKENGRYSVRSLRNSENRIAIDDGYIRLLQETTDLEAKRYLTEKLQQANAVQHALQFRHNTIFQICTAIAAYQHTFFEKGSTEIFPLRIANIAKELNLHPSTISRALRSKYLQCSQGVFALSDFFIHGSSLEQGGLSVKAIVQKIIDSEDKLKPLSDQQVCNRLQQQGCNVSRRTVTKYREELGIPSALIRKIK